MPVKFDNRLSWREVPYLLSDFEAQHKASLSYDFRRHTLVFLMFGYVSSLCGGEELRAQVLEYSDRVVVDTDLWGRTSCLGSGYPTVVLRLPKTTNPIAVKYF